jgi:hypothetical protein
MSWFFSSAAAPATQAAAPQSPASAAAAAFGAAAQDERVQQSARAFAHDPGVQAAAKGFATDKRVHEAALKSVGLGGGGCTSTSTDDSERESGRTSRSNSSVTQQAPARRRSAVESAALGAFAPSATTETERTKADSKTRMPGPLVEQKEDQEEDEEGKEIGKNDGKHEAWFDRIQRPIPGMRDDCAFAQQLRLYALAGNLEREGTEVKQETMRNHCKSGHTEGASGNNPTLVDLFENLLLLHSRKEETRDHASPSRPGFDQAQYAEQGRLADLMVQRIGLAAEEEEREKSVQARMQYHR